MTNHSLNQNLFLGIDVGKTELFCALRVEDESHVRVFKNDQSGIAALTKWIKTRAKNEDLLILHTCMEATGHYTREVSRGLHAAFEGPLYIVNARQIKAFANRRLRRNKSDKADAKIILEFLLAEEDELHSYTPRTPIEREIFELSKQKESDTRDLVSLKVQLQCREFKSTQRLLNSQIKAKEKLIAKAEELINKLIAQDTDKQEQKKLLLAIPGLAEKSVNLLLAQLPPIEDFNNARQLAAWMGVTPKHFESGTSVRRYTPISKMGSTHLRCALFMPALSAMRYNPVIKTFADRLLKNGKARKAVASEDLQGKPSVVPAYESSFISSTEC